MTEPLRVGSNVLTAANVGCGVRLTGDVIGARVGKGTGAKTGARVGDGIGAEIGGGNGAGVGLTGTGVGCTGAGVGCAGLPPLQLAGGLDDMAHICSLIQV